MLKGVTNWKSSGKFSKSEVKISEHRVPNLEFFGT